MQTERLYDEFPINVLCESNDVAVFVACRRGGRYGDVRKTLAGLLQREFSEINIAPVSKTFKFRPTSVQPVPFDDAAVVDDTNNGQLMNVLHAHILVRGGDNTNWTFM